MLFQYPAEATNENWFHDCLVEMLQTINNNLQAGAPIPQWPEIIPEDHRDKLRTYTGLRNRLNIYQTEAAKLTVDEQNLVNQALNEQNQIDQLLSGACSCTRIDDLPQDIQEPVKDLFKFCFRLLTELEIRDRQYKTIYDAAPSHMCPFCGCEFFDAPGAPREALDHYLAESKYPFAAANLHNLVPMGNKCNSKYKLAEDILYKDDGTRRRAIYPYNLGEINIRISLDQSEPFAGTQDLFPLPRWELDYKPDVEEVSTWETVFHINERFKRDILDAEFMSWLREFSSWCKSANISPATETDITTALERYSEHLETMGIRDRAFLKAAVFRMLIHQYRQDNERVKLLINGIVIGGMAL